MSTPPDPPRPPGGTGTDGAPPPAGGGDGGAGGSGGSGGSDGSGGGPDAAPRLTPYLRILRRAVRSVTSLFRAHAMVVRSEAEREVFRVATGVALVLATLAFLLATALLLAVGAVVLIQRVTGLPWLESVALSAGATALVAGVLGLLAWLRLRKPLMPDSRKLLKSTLDGLLKG